MININLIDLGITDYKAALRFQKETLRRRQFREIDDTLILTEHNPVFTIGRQGSRANILVENNVLEAYKIAVYETDRGGDITYHGPGQMVVYPVLDLKGYKKDVRWYLHKLELAVIAFLDKYNIKGAQKNNFNGVWVDEKKIASLGIGVSKWVSYHGLAINISTDLEYFDMINPCGICGAKITSLSMILNKSIGIQEVKDNFILTFEEVFGVKIDHRYHPASMA